MRILASLSMTCECTCYIHVLCGKGDALPMMDERSLHSERRHEETVAFGVTDVNTTKCRMKAYSVRGYPKAALA